jgi:hypothetical protein
VPELVTWITPRAPGASLTWLGVTDSDETNAAAKAASAALKEAVIGRSP